LELCAGLDVSVAETSVCVVDADGKVIRETKVPTEPEAIIAALAATGTAAGAGWKRVGLEAGPLSQWLFSALVEAGYPAICVETRHMRAALSAQINKSDRNDARGIAQMMRVGLYRPVHVKTLASQERRLLLTNRRLLQDKMLDIERELRGTLRNFGLKVGIVSRARFEARVEELVTPSPRLAALVRPLLAARRALREQFALMHRMLLDLVRDEPVCRRLMTAPGVGAVVALAYRVTIDVPARFERSKAVGAALGLTPRRYQSGELDRTGRISKCGDGMLRSLLYEAAQVLLTRASGSWLKAWGLQLAKRRGMKRAIVATARRLAVILHAMWTEGSDFRFTRQDEGASA
jgi:transposase